MKTSNTHQTYSENPEGSHHGVKQEGTFCLLQKKPGALLRMCAFRSLWRVSPGRGSLDYYRLVHQTLCNQSTYSGPSGDIPFHSTQQRPGLLRGA